MQKLTASGLLLLAFALSHAAYAGEEEAAFEAAMPTETNLERLKQRIAGDPNNLDLYFSYAQMARVLRKNEEAAEAMERLLEADPSLMRVKLDLAAVYIALGRYEDARRLFAEVEASNPPPTVQKNIQSAQAVIEQLTKKHLVSGSFTVGINSDSNANSAPGSGNVMVLDTILPLGTTSQGQEDWHAFSALSLNHTYRFDAKPQGPAWRWNSSLLGYTTKQHDLEQLDLMLYSLRTGPELVLPESMTRFSLTANYLFTDLDTHAYLRNPKVEFLAETMLAPNLTVYWRPAYEYRSFINSPSVSTYDDRSGEALQHVVGFRVPLSAQDLVDSNILLRREHAKQNYYANTQYGLYVNYIHSFSNSLVGLFSIGYKGSQYEEADPLISTTIRDNDEYTLSLTFNQTLSPKFVGDVVVSAGYQFREVTSNLENYAYDNHRLTFSATKNF